MVSTRKKGFATGWWWKGSKHFGSVGRAGVERIGGARMCRWRGGNGGAYQAGHKGGKFLGGEKGGLFPRCSVETGRLIVTQGGEARNGRDIGETKSSLNKHRPTQTMK